MKIAIIIILLCVVLILLKLLKEIYYIDLRRVWSKKIDLSDVEFYIPAKSIRSGEHLQLFYHCAEPSNFTLYSAVEETDVLLSVELEPKLQSNKFSYWSGFNWSPLSILIDKQCQSGVYIAKIESVNSDTFSQTVLINSHESKDIGVFLSTNTWCAYNDYGGLSNYRDTASPLLVKYFKIFLRLLHIKYVIGDRHCVPAMPLSFNRPNLKINHEVCSLTSNIEQTESHLFRAEYELLKLLAEEKISYHVYSDYDLAFRGALAQKKLAVFAAHSEYWSEEMIGCFKSFQCGGGNALFLSGNNWYRKVRFYKSGIMVVDQKTDSRDVARELGSGYNADGYLSYAPYQVIDSSHPLFANTGIKDGDIFGGVLDSGRGASGYETDKVNSGSVNTRILAIGLNAEGPAFLTWKTSQNEGGWVCNFGSVASCSWVRQCDTMRSLVKNLLSAVR